MNILDSFWTETRISLGNMPWIGDAVISRMHTLIFTIYTRFISKVAIPSHNSSSNANVPYFTAREFFFLVKSSIFDLHQSQQMKPNYNTTTYDFEICEEVNINKSEGRQTDREHFSFWQI